MYPKVTYSNLGAAVRKWAKVTPFLMSPYPHKSKEIVYFYDKIQLVIYYLVIAYHKHKILLKILNLFDDNL